MMSGLVEYIEGARWRRLVGVMAVVYAVWHALLFALGLRFDLAPLGMFAHYADPVLLRTRLLESCFYLHVQPPLYNLALGVVLKLVPGHEAVAFRALFLASGFALYVLLVVLQTRLGVSRVVALAVATVFMCSPSYLLYEHLLVYTIQCALLLTMAAIFLHEFVRTQRNWAGWAFFLTLFLLGGIRSMYHLMFYAGAAGGVFWFVWPRRRAVFWMALIPGLLLLSFYVKSYVLFDRFTTMSFLSKSPWIKTVGNLSWEQRQALAAAGKISQASLVERFWAVEFYPEDVQRVEGFEGIPVLRETTKSTGEVNYNHLSQLKVADLYMEDSKYVLFHYPKTFLCSTAWAALTFATPCNQIEGIDWLKSFYDRVLYGKLDVRIADYIPFLGASQHQPFVFLLLGLPLLFLYNLWLGLGRGPGLDRAQRAVLLFMAFTVFYVASLSIGVELAETNRYRFETDPFTVAVLGLFVQRVVVSRLAAWRRGNG